MCKVRKVTKAWCRGFGHVRMVRAVAAVGRVSFGSLLLAA